MSDRLKILLVEDSRADARLIVEVFQEEKIAADVDVVRDGEQAMAYMCQEGEYKAAIRPDLILLDLNMPKKDGREVLAELKASDRFKTIPVVILTTSQSDEDVLKSYNLQASCYVIKPMDLEPFIKIIRSLDGFWFTAVRYPPKPCN
jgi:two-component system, chemotaxis family, response regulator Rcp1